MSQSKDHLFDLDRHVQLLEAKVNKLRASLSTWQQWYLEYSSLKEEIEELPKEIPAHEELRRIRRDFDGTLLTKKELNEIIGKTDLREVDQIVGMLSRRLDYVEKNIDTLRKLLETEENRLAAASVVANPDTPNDEESGLPITDIIEELDEEDNVVNYRLQSGSDIALKVVDALKKAGIQEDDIPETEADIKKHESITTGPKGKEKDVDGKPTIDTTSITAAPDHTTGHLSPTLKKRVSFAEDVKPGHGEVEALKSRTAERLEELMKMAKEQEAMDMSTAVMPESESEEDRQMRREMLAYSMSEIGPVVAELQLEEDDFDDDDKSWDMYSDEDEHDYDDEDDDEDDLGRSKHSVLNSDYIARMQELEKRLGVQSVFTVDRSETQPPKRSIEGIGQIAVVKGSVKESAPQAPKLKEKKSVSFATTLDIAPDTLSKAAPAPAPAPAKTKKPKVDPIGDVVEKPADVQLAEALEPAPKRVSRFREERAAGAPLEAPVTGILPPGPHQIPAKFIQSRPVVPVEPTPPEDQTIAAAVVERPTPTEVPEPDEMDNVLLYQAAAVEYNQKRNQLIQQQGGFVEREFGDEDGRVPLDEELGGPKKMSKFKAARLAKLQ
ncbi:Prefoldin subunit-domain-containing protein [Cladorrhinum sp. PSN259]|nr:Prefoldin subunit-domain-containing protein [Cladorrhinum sp. PSN259]